MKYLKSILPRSSTSVKTYKVAFSKWSLLFVLLLGNQPEPVEYRSKDIIEAQKETLKALRLISINLKKGLGKMEYLSEFETARRKIIKL